MSEFGGQTVTFVSVASTGQPGYLGVKSYAAPVESAVSGCRFRPLSPSPGSAVGSIPTETPDGATNTSREVWKLTAPPVSVVLNATSEGEVVYDGVRFQIVGPVQPKRDMDGVLHHVTVMCRKQVT